jgi:hypothetical protein
MAKRTPEELWQKLVDEAGEDRIEQHANMSAAQVDEELAAAGFDVAAEDAEAEAFLGALERGEVPQAAQAQDKSGARARQPVVHAEPKAATPPRAPRRLSARVVWLVAATASAAAGGAVYVSNLQQVAHRAPAPDLAAASDLRQRAKAALDAGRAQECLSLLDEAKTKDLDGDSAENVMRLREQAERALKPPR